MELLRPWHQILIRRDPAPGEAAKEKAAGKIQFELARRLPAWETPEERTSSSWWLLGPWQCQPVRGELPESGSHQPRRLTPAWGLTQETHGPRKALDTGLEVAAAQNALA